MHLKIKVLNYLIMLSDNDDGRSFFFPSKNLNCDIVGSFHGQMICILILEGRGRMNKQEIKFSARVLQSGGEHYTIRCIEDIFEIAKIKGWL